MINFLEVEHTVKDLKEQIETGTIDQETLNAKLLALIDVGADGCYWMLGHKTGRWYRHDGSQWIADNPGELIVDLHHQNTPHGPVDAAGNLYKSVAVTNWDSVDFNWFLIGLVAVGSIFFVVYSSIM